MYAAWSWDTVSNPNLMAVHLVQRAQIWPSLYQNYEWMCALRTTLTRPEHQTSVTSKALCDSGRSSFSPPNSRIKRRLCSQGALSGDLHYILHKAICTNIHLRKNTQVLDTPWAVEPRLDKLQVFRPRLHWRRFFWIHNVSGTFLYLICFVILPQR